MKITEENLSEELRVLYVAMTRAREKLIMLCSYNDAKKELQKFQNTELPVASELLQNSHSSADWIVMTALRRKEAEKIGMESELLPVKTEDEPWDISLVDASRMNILRNVSLQDEHTESADPEKVSEIGEMMEWQYPYEDVKDIPSKLTATELKGNFTEEETHEEAEELSILKRFSRPPQKPDFSFKPKKLTAAQRGTATHLVMQFADYSKCLTTDGVREEIKRLVAIRNLTEEQAAAIRPEIISSFFNSHEGQLILTADKVWRELKFSTLVDSGMISGYGKGEQILLQGVVDCCVEKDGKLIVIDFKTDYVTKETVRERAEFYRGQLDAYSIAMKKIMNKPVSETVLYFLSAGISVTL
jgi:ATP-dependent helicase/nuclease subunit A